MAAGSAAVRRPALVGESGLHRAGGGALETTVDQALIRGLGTAFRGCVSGLSSCLESGRRAAPGHITSDGGSPSVAPSPALCSGVRFGAWWRRPWVCLHPIAALCSRAPSRSRPLAAAAAARRAGLDGGGGLSNILQDRMPAACGVLSPSLAPALKRLAPPGGRSPTGTPPSHGRWQRSRRAISCRPR